MTADEFNKYLEMYGSNIDSWPQHIQQHAYTSIQKSSEIRRLLNNEEEFERFLNSREIEYHSPDFQNRIIDSINTASKKVVKNRRSMWSYLNEIFISLNLPRPAFSLGIVLFIGITLGYIINSHGITNFQDETDIGMIAFYEGEIYEFED
jgi:hypothetical protein